jgi:hypothetical protein
MTFEVGDRVKKSRQALEPVRLKSVEYRDGYARVGGRTTYNARAEYERQKGMRGTVSEVMPREGFVGTDILRIAWDDGTKSECYADAVERS